MHMSRVPTPCDAEREGGRPWLPRTLPCALPGVYGRGQLLDTLLHGATGPGLDRVPVVGERPSQPAAALPPSQGTLAARS